ncbi:MAG TPA: helix-turn-helix domain-containing protein [Novimethylophilus sp.]|jgi:DNA-binding HxlR family transcriptional regulator|uniref:winged helix-turn-helix transcriptional regulator n=1 Tax=Novimethylophilus sp. TaxID=2137426 RepID=UPI002F420884
MSKTPRSYNQFCALAKALDIVGERWTLLIARELLSGPKRFKDLHDALPGIGTNLLSARLKEMEQHGLVVRGKLPPPAASAVYELTDRGRGLGSVVGELVKWGFSLLGIPEPDEFFRPRWAMQALLVTFDPDAAKEVSETYEFRIDDETFHLRVSDGKAEGLLGPASRPDLVVVATRLEFLTLGFGENQRDYAVEKGLIKQGSVEMLERFGRIFRHLR